MLLAIALILFVIYCFTLGVIGFELGWSFAKISPMWLNDALGGVLLWRGIHFLRICSRQRRQGWQAWARLLHTR